MHNFSRKRSITVEDLFKYCNMGVGSTQKKKYLTKFQHLDRQTTVDKSQYLLLLNLAIFSRCCETDSWWFCGGVPGRAWWWLVGICAFPPHSIFFSRDPRASSRSWSIPLCSCSNPYNLILFASCWAFFFKRQALWNIIYLKIFYFSFQIFKITLHIKHSKKQVEAYPLYICFTHSVSRNYISYIINHAILTSMLICSSLFWTWVSRWMGVQIQVSNHLLSERRGLYILISLEYLDQVNAIILICLCYNRNKNNTNLSPSYFIICVIHIITWKMQYLVQLVEFSPNVD